VSPDFGSPVTQPQIDRTQPAESANSKLSHPGAVTVPASNAVQQPPASTELSSDTSLSALAAQLGASLQGVQGDLLSAVVKLLQSQPVSDCY
jgi:hypothetical protein